MSLPDRSDYKGKTYLVTGATGSIGQACCQLLAQYDARLILLARTGQNLRKLKDALPGENHAIYPFDMARIADIENLATEILQNHGQLSGILYCVGNGDICRLGKLTYDRLHAIMLTNFYGYMELIRAFYKHKERVFPLAIVGISSLASSSPEKYFAAYSASKAAMESATRCLAIESASKNTTIKMISPGVVASDRVNYLGDISGDLDQKIREKGFQPMGLIPVDAIASMAVYLLSDKAWYINGCTVPINGGAPC